MNHWANLVIYFAVTNKNEVIIILHTQINAYVQNVVIKDPRAERHTWMFYSIKVLFINSHPLFTICKQNCDSFSVDVRFIYPDLQPFGVCGIITGSPCSSAVDVWLTVILPLK